jgi:putative ABC transport system permease protein
VREIGVLKSVGWSNNRIILMIIGESLFLCLISGVIGILFSFLVINYIISNFLSFEMILSPLMFFKAFLILLCIGILGGFYPSLKASSFSPSESLKYE